MKKAERNKLHKLVREYVMLRDKVCLKCGKSGNLHASHIYPRGKYPKMQFKVENVKALCLGCHLYWWHKHPIDAAKWLNNTLDKARLKRLKILSNTINKELWDFKEIENKLKKKIEELKNG